MKSLLFSAIWTGRFGTFFASVQIDLIAGDHHFNGFRIIREVLPKPKAGKETSQKPGTNKAHFTGSMGLRFEEQQTQNQVTETSAAAILKDADIAQTVDAVFPPDTTGCNRDGILIDESVPAENVQVVCASAEDSFTDRNNFGKI